MLYKLGGGGANKQDSTEFKIHSASQPSSLQLPTVMSDCWLLMGGLFSDTVQRISYHQMQEGRLRMIKHRGLPRGKMMTTLMVVMMLMGKLRATAPLVQHLKCIYIAEEMWKEWVGKKKGPLMNMIEMTQK